MKIGQDIIPPALYSNTSTFTQGKLVMLRFISSLFSSTAVRSQGVDDELINAAIDRVIESTDKRLQALGSYRRQLREPVEKAVDHVIRFVDAMPEPVEISRRTFSNDPRLHAFFASFEHMQEKIGRAKTVEAYLKQAPEGDHSRIYGLLSMQWVEKSRLGTVLQDDCIQREVQQVAVNFLNHNFLGPSVSLEESTRNIKKRAFEFMIEIALERIIADRTRRAELEQQRLLLQRKLKAMKTGQWGFEEMLRPETSGSKDFDSLEAEIASVDKELEKIGASHDVLDRNLQIIKDTLGSPEELLAMRTVQLELDSMNIKADTSTAARLQKLELEEVYSSIGAARILLPGWFPVDELPGGRESIADAMRYL